MPSKENNEKKKPRRRRLETQFASNLQRVMDERNINLKGIAELAGVTPGVCSGWLTGSSPADFIAVQKLARALRVNFEWLLTGTTTNVHVKDLSLAEIFEEVPAFDGIYRISATKLVQRGRSKE